MSYQVIETEGKKYVEAIPGEILIESEREALDLVAACGENETPLLMIHAENLTPDFYHLRTGLAGDVLLKFINYRLKVVAVLRPELVEQGKFQEMVIESNRGPHFHVSYDRESAEKWLIGPP